MAMQLPNNDNPEFVLKMNSLMREATSLLTISIVSKGEFSIKLVLEGEVYKVLETYNSWVNYLTKEFKSLELAQEYFNKQKACLLFELNEKDLLSDWLKPDGTQFRVLGFSPVITVSYADSIGEFVVGEEFFWGAVRIS